MFSFKNNSEVVSVCPPEKVLDKDAIECRMKSTAVREYLNQGRIMRNRSTLTAKIVGVLVISLLSYSLGFAEMRVVPSERYVPGEVIVGFYPQATSDQIDFVVSNTGGKIISRFNTPNAIIARIKLPVGGPSVEEVMDNLKSNHAFAGIIKYVEPNVTRKAF